MVNSNSFTISSDLEVLVAVMADATAIDSRFSNAETRLTTSETVLGIKSASTVLIESMFFTDTQAAFNALEPSKTYIDMRNTATVQAYTGREFGCSFTVSGTSTKVPTLSSSYTNLLANISIKNLITNTYETWTKTGTGSWFNYYNMVRSPAEILKIIRGTCRPSTSFTGNGFSVVPATDVGSTAKCTITFTGNPFSTQVDFVASPFNVGVIVVVITNNTPMSQSVIVQTFNPNVGPHMSTFSFIAIGS